MKYFPTARQFLDVGSGSGIFAAEVNRRGGQAIAVENSPRGLSIGRRQGVDCRPFDLNKAPPAEVPEAFDLVYCFEVAEHLPPPLDEKLIAFLTSFGTEIVFTAAHPGQGGTAHINEQPKEHWIAQFRERKFSHDEGLSQALSCEFEEEGAATWFVKNVCAFRPLAGLL